GEKAARLEQAQPDSAQPERRIGRRASRLCGRLVRPEVVSADRDRHAVHFNGDFAIGLELLVFVGQVCAIEEQELAAKEPYARCAVVLRLGNVGGQLDVRVQLDVHPVDGGGAGILQPPQLLALDFELVLTQVILGEGRLIGIDDHHALGAVHDQQLVLADQLARRVQGDDRRNVQAARDHSSVRGDPAQIGDEARELVPLELHYVRGRQIARHQYEISLAIGVGRRRDISGLACQRLEHPLDDLYDVGLALAQISVLDLVEAGQQRVQLHLDRPLGVALLVFNDLAWRDRQRRILEYRQMQVYDRDELGRTAGRNAGAYFLELFAHAAYRPIEAHALPRHLVGGHDVVRSLELCVRYQMRPADGDAAGDADAVEGEAHKSSFELRVSSFESVYGVFEPEIPSRKLETDSIRFRRSGRQ